MENVIADGEAKLDRLVEDPDETAADGRRRLTAAGSCLRRLSRLSERVARARVARDKLFERSLPSAGEIRIKVEAAQRMVTKAEARLAEVTAGHREMAARLASVEGRQLYARRGALVEPGFAQLFQRFGRRVHQRGTAAVDTEIKLLGAVHNLNKIFRHDARQRTA